MVIVKVQGGIGNQMFIYALSMKLKKCGRYVKLDTSIYGKTEMRQLSQLSQAFEKASIEEIHRWQEYKTDIFSSIRRNLGLRKKEHIREKADYMPEIFEKDNIYLDGYWQNEKYFKDVRADILDFWSTVKIEDEHYLPQIQNAEAVCVHVRRGDYLQLDNIYGNICTKEYYQKAMQMIKDNIGDPTFFFFSDDIEWVKENIKTEKAVYVDTGNSCPEHDLFLMSQCRHHIIANSSYSWWGAWLNKREDKVVISPKKWFNDRAYHLASPEWTLL